MADRDTCQGTNAQGEPCRSPFVGEDGYCDAHRPGNENVMSERARRGAYARNNQAGRPQGLEAEELPPLESMGDAKLWLETVGRAVAVGRLGEKQANAAIRAVEAWTTAHSEHLAEEKLAEVVEEIERAKQRAQAA